MAKLTILPSKGLKGEIEVPGDKSISHRAVMLGSIANGETIVHNFLNSADCLATASCFDKLGIEIKHATRDLPAGRHGTRPVTIIKGKGLRGLSKPDKVLDVGNSGTTIRLLSGILAGQAFESEINGDQSIQKRPMKRIAEPLTKMGAQVSGKGDVFPPLKISGGKLKGIKYAMPVASAQVKSCILLAGLYAQGTTTVIEKVPSRDHTERMLAYFGVPVKKFMGEISLEGGEGFEGKEIFVPGDISSAAFFIVAGVLIPNSELRITNVGMNPTRIGILEVLHRMGADVAVTDEEIVCGEPRANIKVKGQGARVKGIEIKGEIIPRIIDEVPIIAVLATQAEGQTIIRDAKELRVKESDRIKTISTELRKMGAKIEEREDGIIITGKTKLKGAVVKSYGDHRIAMAMAVAGLIAEGETTIEDTDCIETSFPGFEKLLTSLIS